MKRQRDIESEKSSKKAKIMDNFLEIDPNDPENSHFLPLKQEELRRGLLYNYGYKYGAPQVNETPFFPQHMNSLFYIPRIFNPETDQHLFQSIDNSIPKVIQPQLRSQVFCPWASFCNLFQRKIYDYKTYMIEFDHLLRYYAGYSGLDEENIKICDREIQKMVKPNNLNAEIDDQSRVLIAYHKFTFPMRSVMMNPKRAKPDIINGFIYFIDPSNGTNHAIAIRNRYAVDSFGLVYPWNGFIMKKEGRNYVIDPQCTIITAVEIQLPPLPILNQLK
jgi:hypothetical protein